MIHDMINIKRYLRNINLLHTNKDMLMTVKTKQFYYNLLLHGYMFRFLRVIIRPTNELTQDYLIPNALRDPVALTMGGVIPLAHHPL